MTMGRSEIGATSSLPDLLAKVPSQYDLPIFVMVYCRVSQQCIQAFESPSFVCSHQPRIARYIGGEDRRKNGLSKP